MPRKLFTVDSSNEKPFHSLRTTLAGEPDVEIIYDRRNTARRTYRNGAERRSSADLSERIRTDGFAVVLPPHRRSDQATLPGPHD